jgi:hypothetical protein
MARVVSESLFDTSRAAAVREEDMAPEVLDLDEKDCSMEEGDENAEPFEQAIERTASQALKQETLEQARRKIQDTEGPVSKLRREIARVHTESRQADPKRALASLEGMRKRARNFGEDILEETLKLDSLSNLLPEDRLARKEAIRQADALLEGVDTMKAELASLLQRFALEAETAAKEEEEQDEAQEQPSPPPKRSAPADPVPASPRPPAPQSARAGAGVPLPQPSMWTQVRLPLRFSLQEGGARYFLTSARIPALDTQSLRLQLTRGGSLSISGVCLPTAEECAEMQQEVARQLRGHTEKTLSAYGGIAGAAEALYAQLGKGAFGSFAEAVRLPEDIDVDAIRTTCEAGVIQVVLPKVLPHPARQPLHPHHVANSFQGRAARPAGFDSRQFGRHSLGRNPFGGSMDDLFRW